MKASTPLIGSPMLRVDAADKAAGATKYLRDLPPPPGALHAALVRSPVARGILRDIRPDPAFDWSSVVFATASDIPGDNVVEMHDRTMPLLGAVGAELRYRGEPVAVVAAETPERAREAASRVSLDIDPLPALSTLSEAVAVFKRDPAALETLVVQNIEKGDLAAGFAAADDTYESEYTAGHQEQLYLDPQGLDVTPEPDGSILVEGSIQCPYFPAVELLPALALRPGQIRVRQTMMGGAFGGKEDYPSMLAGYAALPALKSGRPVRIAYDRHEDMLFTPKRHPVWVRFKTGFKRDGSLTALECDFILDGGAYMTISDVVMYRGILHCALAYRCPNVVIRGRVARTNSMPCGAFRGFGAPQAVWGLESHVDAIAARLGIPPHQWRLQNHNRPGDTTPTGQLLTPENGSTAVLETAIARSSFAEKWAAASRGRLARGEKVLRGIGLSFFAHGSAFTGDGEAKFKAKGRVELVRRPDGAPGVDIRVSSTEMGQGVHTVFTQIAADALSIPASFIRFPLADTGLVPNSGPTVASRTTMVVGNVVWSAAADLRKKLEAYASSHRFSGAPATLRAGSFRADGHRPVPFADVASAFLDENGPAHGFFEFLLPPETQWDQRTFKGDAYPGYSWAANVAEVEIDPLTCIPRVTKVTAVIDIGRVINPQTAHGQVEGGLTQALGYSLMEKMATSPKTGLFDASRLQTYIVPTALDTPEFDISFVEYPYTFAPPGAKGLGELPMDGLAPAIANAIESATGARLRTLPLTPESLFSSLHPT